MKNKLNKILCILFGMLIMFGNIASLKAASAAITVSSSTSKIVIGNTFTVTIKLSSSYTLGTWEWTVDYDKSKFKLTSGDSNIVGFGDGSKKSVSYTYKFKAIGNGNGKISVKSYSALKYDDKSEFSIKPPTAKTVNVITQAELEASYSKNNNLSSLSIDGYTLSPAFNKNVTSYTVQAGANVETINIKATKEDSKAKVTGVGTVEVGEGENKVQIIVTAENDSIKTYTIMFTVVDENPIEVTINEEKLTVVKRADKLIAPENYILKEIKINKIPVPSFYSELNGYSLVGLKNTEGDIKLYIYNEKDNSYTLYSETKLNQSLLQPLPMDKSFDESYKKGTVTIGESVFECYTMSESDYSIIHAKDLTTGKSAYYMYDSKTNTVITYNDEETQIYKGKSEKYFQIILLLGGETAIVFIVLIVVLLNNLIKNGKKKKLIKEEALKKEEKIQKSKDLKEKKKEPKRKIKEEVEKKEEA